MQSSQKSEEQNKDEEKCEEEDQLFPCTYHNCNKLFSPSEFVPLFSKANENDKDQFQKVFESLMRTQLFCKTCCSKHATILCMNNKIVVEQ